MLSVSFDSKSLLLPAPRGAVRRFPVVAVSFEAGLFDPEVWAAVLAQVRAHGFNTVSIRVPWALHEPSPGLFDFSGPRNLRRALELVAAADLKAILRIGPCVGGSHAMGGLPGWIPEIAGVRVREADPAFLVRVAAFWRRLAAEFADLQATRNGHTAPRIVLAVGIDDDWRSLDGSVGEPYFAALVRYAREVGIDVPLFTANNCWYVHEGLGDAWHLASDADAATTALELRAVQGDTPPMLLDSTPDAARLVGALAARADVVVEALPFAHAGATSALGARESGGSPLAPLARVAVLASSFGELLAGLSPDTDAPIGPTRVLRGPGRERVTIAAGDARNAKASRNASAATTARHVAADGSVHEAPVGSACGFDFYASDLAIAGARLERCSGALVALLGDIVVIAGRARAKLRVKIDGSETVLPVPADDGTPKAVKVRGLRVVAVPFAMADGVRVDGTAGLAFVDADGTPLLRIGSDGAVRREKSRTPEAVRGATRLRLAPAVALAQASLVDGTHARFASVGEPESLGAYGVVADSAYYAVRLGARRDGKSVSRRPKLLAMPWARLGGGRVFVDGACLRRDASEILSLAPSKSPRCIVAEVRAPGFAPGAAPVGAFGELRAGVFGPLVELAPMKVVDAGPRAKSAARAAPKPDTVACEPVPMPSFDGTTIGRFVLGYDSRDPEDADGATTLRWTFAPRASALVVRFPHWWVEASRAARPVSAAALFHDALRLNGALVLGGVSAFAGGLVWLDGAKLSPMRPKALAKGEKPPRGRNVKLEPGPNELLLDLAGLADRPELLRGAKSPLARLRAEVEFYEVVRTVAGDAEAAWSFARVDPPASWAGATPAPKRASGSPAWFRTAFSVDASQAVELVATFEPGRCASVWVNGSCVIAQDGVSGAVGGARKAAACIRRARVPAALVRSGVNEIGVFDADGAMPSLEVRALR